MSTRFSAEDSNNNTDGDDDDDSDNKPGAFDECVGLQHPVRDAQSFFRPDVKMF